MRFVLWLAIVSAGIWGNLRAQPRPPDHGEWGGLEYLLGDWTGEGGGGPGQGTGAFSFAPSLQGKILVRKNHAAYPAKQERPASAHDDLMIVYREGPEKHLRAIYFDSEEHLIRYAVEEPPGGGQIVFVSAPEPSAPSYRLTYTRVDANGVKIKFEIAPPGHPEQFATYIEATAHRDTQSGPP